MNLFDYTGNYIETPSRKVLKTNLGIPYVGNKRALSYDLLKFIAHKYQKVTTIYDLFGGAGGFSFNALTNGYDVVYNELAEYPFNLVKFVLENDSTPNEALQFCSKEDFKSLLAKENKTPTDFVKLFTYSFRCNGSGYFCSPKKEAFKKQGHNMIVFQDENSVKFWNHYFNVGYLFDEFLTFGDIPLAKRRNIYANVMLKIESLSVTNLLQKFQKEKKAYTISDFLNIKTKEVCAYIEANMPSNTPLKNYKTKRYPLERLEQLEQLERLLQLKQKNTLKIFNLDYKEIKIPKDDNVLIYCDIPYKDLSDEYHLGFNHDYFYEWALKNAKQGYNILISEYDMPLKKFECVFFKEVHNRTSKKTATEKLFKPKV